MGTELCAAGKALANPLTYTNEESLHDALALLRRESPVHWVEAEGYRPFWAITRHEDIVNIELSADQFVNAPRTILMPTAVEEQIAVSGGELNVLVRMDGLEHKAMRAISAAWFEPRALRKMQTIVAQLAKQFVDNMKSFGGECEFVEDIAMPLSLHIILPLLGLSEADYPTVRRLSREFFGQFDQENARSLEPSAVPAVKTDILAYFEELSVARRNMPTDDLASAIANARISGKLLSNYDAISYYYLIMSAGQETTGAVLAGGLQALIEHPEQLRRLQRDPTLISTAVDEMIRWVTPTKAFMRTATKRHVLRGVAINSGDALLLSYSSANRDEDVFENPFEFNVGRRPSKHLSFGRGVHYCLGAALAKMEIGTFFAELIPRLKNIELDGRPELTATTFAGGLKRLPIRYTIDAG
jgi:cytochrome P450